MKDEFFGFYTPTLEEVNTIWGEGIFIFDANVLLNLYRYSGPTRDDFLRAFEKIKERLFLPYQVGFEFHSNRNTVIDSMTNSYGVFLKGAKDVLVVQLQNHFNQYKRHPAIELDKFEGLLEEFLKKVETELDKQRKKHPDFTSKDDVLNALTKLFNKKVGKQFSKEEAKKIYAEGKDRYENQIPPGYKDLDTKKNKGEQNLYGDLLIWKEIIAYAIKNKREIILVTDDRKEDWWSKEGGKSRPRHELIKEFYDLTKKRILIYNADQFLFHAKERKLVNSIKPASIEEVSKVRVSDEKLDEYYSNLINLAADTKHTLVQNQLRSSLFQSWLNSTSGSNIGNNNFERPMSNFVASDLWTSADKEKIRMRLEDINSGIEGFATLPFSVLPSHLSKSIIESSLNKSSNPSITQTEEPSE